MTTSRYFTPSGRSIQRIDYSSFRKSKGTPTDTAVFYTRIGRTVRELSGIEPDTILNDVTLPAPIQHLVSNNVLFRFATWYTSNLEAPPQSYDKIVETFIRYLDNVPPGKRSAVLASLAESRRTAEADGYPPAVIRSLEQTERLAEREFQRTLRSHADVLRVHLEREIRHRFEPERVRAAIDLRLDYVVQATSSILSSRRYALFLEQPVAGDQ
jgi:carboxyl-terminal processing protease